MNLTAYPSISTFGGIRAELNIRVKYEIFSDFNVWLTFWDSFNTRPTEARGGRPPLESTRGGRAARAHLRDGRILLSEKSLESRVCKFPNELQENIRMAHYYNSVLSREKVAEIRDEAAKLVTVTARSVFGD